jgi:TolA-binding protein
MSRLIAGALLALGATGCFATKGDIRLLQDEIRAARASAAQADSARRRTSDSLTAALANLARVQALAARDAQQSQQKTAAELAALKNSDIGTREQLKAINADLDQLHEIARQNARGQALTRAQLEQANAARQAAANASDSTAADSTTAAPVPSGPPGPATLLVQGRSLIINGSCSTARRNFQDIITQFPDSPEAAEAMFSIADSYGACGDGNPARADSVYRLVIEKYPRSDFAAISYYKRAEALRQAGNTAEARPLYAKIVCDYPKSTVVAQAINRLGNQRPACR